MNIPLNGLAALLRASLGPRWEDLHPDIRARDVPFEFNLSPAQNTGWIKERLYHFNDGRFEFRSVMSLTRNGELIEQFPYGLGMKIKLGAEGNAGDKLYFRDDGYFLRIGKRRILLPRWLGVGRFTLMHQNIDRENFTVEIRIDHPLFGRLFYQHGVFKQGCVASNTAPSRYRPAATLGAIEPSFSSSG